MNIMIDVIYRQQIQPSDADAISAIVKSSGFFSAEEINIAVELAQEKLELAGDSSYHFLFAEKSNQVIGYTCWGPIPATKDSFDLYWIAVRKDLCGRGLGKALLSHLAALAIHGPCPQHRQSFAPVRKALLARA